MDFTTMFLSSLLRGENYRNSKINPVFRLPNRIILSGESSRRNLRSEEQRTVPPKKP